MPLAAGELNRRVTFHVATATSDSMGGYTEAWGNLATVPNVWAKLEPLRGAELVAAQQIHRDVRWRITTRWRSDITAAVGATFYEGTVRHALQVSAVLPVRMEGVLHLDCREVPLNEVGL